MHYPRTDTYLLELRRSPDERTVDLSWNDGASARVPYDMLQGFCPCAHCRGHEGGEITYQQPSRPITSLDVAQVGNYAVSIAFAGGCNAGIFHFDFLREVCRREGLLQRPALA
ncbi:MAG: DUF971 domain-containing protein [Acidobacteriota bacterium]